MSKIFVGNIWVNFEIKVKDIDGKAKKKPETLHQIA